jgi:hypothetical protein
MTPMGVSGKPAWVVPELRRAALRFPHAVRQAKLQVELAATERMRRHLNCEG